MRGRLFGSGRGALQRGFKLGDATVAIFLHGQEIALKRRGAPLGVLDLLRQIRCMLCMLGDRVRELGDAGGSALGGQLSRLGRCNGLVGNRCQLHLRSLRGGLRLPLPRCQFFHEALALGRQRLALTARLLEVSAQSSRALFGSFLSGGRLPCGRLCRIDALLRRHGCAMQRRRHLAQAQLALGFCRLGRVCCGRNRGFGRARALLGRVGALGRF